MPAPISRPPAWAEWESVTRHAVRAAGFIIARGTALSSVSFALDIALLEVPFDERWSLEQAVLTFTPGGFYYGSGGVSPASGIAYPFHVPATVSATLFVGPYYVHRGVVGQLDGTSDAYTFNPNQTVTIAPTDTLSVHLEGSGITADPVPPGISGTFDPWNPDPTTNPVGIGYPLTFEAQIVRHKQRA